MMEKGDRAKLISKPKKLKNVPKVEEHKKFFSEQLLGELENNEEKILDTIFSSEEFEEFLLYQKYRKLILILLEAFFLKENSGLAKIISFLCQNQSIFIGFSSHYSSDNVISDFIVKYTDDEEQSKDVKNALEKKQLASILQLCTENREKLDHICKFLLRQTPLDGIFLLSVDSDKKNVGAKTDEYKFGNMKKFCNPYESAQKFSNYKDIMIKVKYQKDDYFCYHFSVKDGKIEALTERVIYNVLIDTNCKIRYQEGNKKYIKFINNLHKIIKKYEFVEEKTFGLKDLEELRLYGSKEETKLLDLFFKTVEQIRSRNVYVVKPFVYCALDFLLKLIKVVKNYKKKNINDDFAKIEQLLYFYLDKYDLIDKQFSQNVDHSRFFEKLWNDIDRFEKKTPLLVDWTLVVYSIILSVYNLPGKSLIISDDSDLKTLIMIFFKKIIPSFVGTKISEIYFSQISSNITDKKDGRNSYQNDYYGLSFDYPKRVEFSIKQKNSEINQTKQRKLQIYQRNDKIFIGFDSKPIRELFAFDVYRQEDVYGILYNFFDSKNFSLQYDEIDEQGAIRIIVTSDDPVWDANSNKYVIKYVPNRNKIFFLTLYTHINIYKEEEIQNHNILINSLNFHKPDLSKLDGYFQKHGFENTEHFVAKLKSRMLNLNSNKFFLDQNGDPIKLGMLYSPNSGMLKKISMQECNYQFLRSQEKPTVSLVNEVCLNVILDQQEYTKITKYKAKQYLLEGKKQGIIQEFDNLFVKSKKRKKSKNKKNGKK